MTDDTNSWKRLLASLREFAQENFEDEPTVLKIMLKHADKMISLPIPKTHSNSNREELHQKKKHS